MQIWAGGGVGRTWLVSGGAWDVTDTSPDITAGDTRSDVIQSNSIKLMKWKDFYIILQ